MPNLRTRKKREQEREKEQITHHPFPLSITLLLLLLLLLLLCSNIYYCYIIYNCTEIIANHSTCCECNPLCMFMQESERECMSTLWWKNARGGCNCCCGFEASVYWSKQLFRCLFLTKKNNLNSKFDGLKAYWLSTYCKNEMKVLDKIRDKSV
jgi:hypothetical protein